MYISGKYRQYTLNWSRTQGVIQQLASESNIRNSLKKNAAMQQFLIGLYYKA